MKRVILIVLDSVGAGALPDAASYGDEKAATLQNLKRANPSLSLPNLEELGLGYIQGLDCFKKVPMPGGAFGRMAEKSPGKDTTTGHWEMMGIILERQFPLYPEGFPRELIAEFERITGYRTIGNKAASGTEIIAELGEEHMKTGALIVYTSADSVFQIAAHEEIVPVEELYEICRKAREMLKGEHAVGRVIARPFVGRPGAFKRTERRHDFSLEPPQNLLDELVAAGIMTCGVGKIKDIFASRGICKALHTASNMEGVDRTLEFMASEPGGLIFTNLVDFDMLYGHRNDIYGYSKALQDFDSRIVEIDALLKEEDILIITADHGCDPTHPGTDHTREYVPLIVTGPSVKKGVALGTRSSFSDVAATIGEYFGLERKFEGESFLGQIL